MIDRPDKVAMVLVDVLVGIHEVSDEQGRELYNQYMSDIASVGDAEAVNMLIKSLEKHKYFERHGFVQGV